MEYAEGKMKRFYHEPHEPHPMVAADKDTGAVQKEYFTTEAQELHGVFSMA